MNPGLFITFEGLDGTGKSTQLRRVVQYLRKCGRRVLVTREPGGTRTGERVRDILLASKTGKLAPLAELALMYAARAQLLAEVVNPALARGDVVVSDRFNTASFAYQGYGRELGTAAVRAFDRVICGTTQPDLTIILDLDPELALGRALGRERQRQSRPDRFEAQGLAFHQRVRAGYLALARKSPRRIKVVRADQSVDELQHQIRALIDPLFVRKVRSSKLETGNWKLEEREKFRQRPESQKAQGE
ncbi:MAG: dTMP kinase [Terriglobia bacterium]